MVGGFSQQFSKLGSPFLIQQRFTEKIFRREFWCERGVGSRVHRPCVRRKEGPVEDGLISSPCRSQSRCRGVHASPRGPHGRCSLVQCICMPPPPPPPAPSPPQLHASSCEHCMCMPHLNLCAAPHSNRILCDRFSPKLPEY